MTTPNTPDPASAVVDLDALQRQLDGATVTLLEYATEFDAAVQGLAAPAGAQASANIIAEGTLALITELRAHRAEKAPPVYPDTLPDGQRVMQPAPSVRAVVSPSGYVARIYDGRLGEYERLVRYVLAPLPAPPKGQDGANRSEAPNSCAGCSGKGRDESGGICEKCLDGGT